MTLSATALQQVFKQDGGGFLVLLVISHADIDPSIRVVNNTVDVTSNLTVDGVPGTSETFVAFPFDIVLPNQVEDSPGEAQLTIDNVSDEIGRTLRLISTRATVEIFVVRMDDTNIVEVAIPPMYLVDVSIDASIVRGRLASEDLTREPYPARSYSPAEFPGLLR